MSLDVDGDSGDSDSVIAFAQAEARKKSKATSASATCARKRPHPGATKYRIKFKPEWKKKFPSLQVRPIHQIYHICSNIPIAFNYRLSPISISGF